MKKTISFVLFALTAMTFAGCNDTETYADQKEDERNNINNYISNHGINVISEETFYAQDSTTNLANNEYVLFESSGVYMQIVRKGCGEKIKNGESTTVLCRFIETNIEEDAVSLTNDFYYYGIWVDKMTVTNSGGTFTASFVSTSESLLANNYGSTSVPSGWLTPLTFINVGRPSSEDEQIAAVNLIVPHSQGHSTASSYVTPYHYYITYERGI